MEQRYIEEVLKLNTPWLVNSAPDKKTNSFKDLSVKLG